MVQTDAMFITHRRWIVELVATNRVINLKTATGRCARVEGFAS